MARKQVLKLNLSEHTLDIRYNRQSWENSKLDLDELDDYIKELVTDKDGFRKYQYDAIRDLLFYLWTDKYNSIKELAKENWQLKPSIQQRFTSEDHFLNMLPLPDKLSGVVHMATGTGKSYVMFAVAYLSIVLGFVKRVLVLGPSSTIIEEGLWGKFREHVFGERGQELIKKLPQQCRNIPINLLNETQPIEDYSITIENINAIFNKDRNSIGDTLFSNTDEVLVLSDEVHHAYSHLNFRAGHFEVESGGRGGTRDERIWMNYIRTEPKIKRHIGFTGTPYMSTSTAGKGNAYFTDVVFNYSIKDAVDEQYIKRINPIIHTEADEEFRDLSLEQRFEMILKNHQEFKRKYSYSQNKKSRVKPITIFICPAQTFAQQSTQKFINFLAKWEKAKSNKSHPLTYYHFKAAEKVMCVISKPGEERYDEDLRTIEDLDNKREFIFAVNRLSEGWDVDNVFQIVPMKDRLFNSKLLISQVLGRGLRIPREVSKSQIIQNYPIVTITNHEKFAGHIKELVDSVTMCETRITSRILTDQNQSKRAGLNFTLFNVNYLPSVKFEKKSAAEQVNYIQRMLLLTKPKEKLGLRVFYDQGEIKYDLEKDFRTVDEVAIEIAQRFKLHEFESEHFDFGQGAKFSDLPTNDDIEEIIRSAMKKARFQANKLSEINRQQINLYFNQFFPKGKKKRVFENIQGDLMPISTSHMDNASIRTTGLERDAMIFMSDKYQEELTSDNLFVLEELEKKYKNQKKQEEIGQTRLFDVEDTFIQTNRAILHHLFDSVSPIIVNLNNFKTPLDTIFTSHNPEKEFVYLLIKYSDYFESWVKARDMGFYAIDYEYWRKGKDRKRGSFNPDFFIKQDLAKYMRLVEKNDDNLVDLKKLEEKGIETIIRVVEIKSDEDSNKVTLAKERYAKEHFKNLNKRLQGLNPADIEKEYRRGSYQYYTFDLLRPVGFLFWFSNLKTGGLRLKM